MNQDDIDQLNRPVTRNEIQQVIKTLPTNSSPGPDGFTGEFYQTYSLLKLFKRLNKKKHSQRPSKMPPSP